MKAVIVEIRNNKAAALSDNGCVVTMKNNGYEIGQEIQIIDSKVQFTKKIAVFAASAAAFVILGTGTWAYATPYSYVSVDVNPSIEYTVNRFDRVLSVKAVNDDSEEILQEITLDHLKNKTIEDAILKTVEQITVAGYFNTTTEGGIVITAASEHTDKSEELANVLALAVEEEIGEAEENVIVEAYSVGLERVEEARELGVTPGKLNLVEKLQASSSDPASVDVEEWLNRSVKDIMKATKENRRASSESGSVITKEEKASDRSEKENAKEEKREEQKQQKDEHKLQKDEHKQQKHEHKLQKDEQKQQKDEYKQQKDEQKQQKDEQKQQKDEYKQQKDEQKQQKNDHKQQKHDDPSINKSKEDQKDVKVEDTSSASSKGDQKLSESKKDKAAKQSGKDKKKSELAKDQTEKQDKDDKDKIKDSSNSDSRGGNHGKEGSGNTGSRK